MTPALDLSFLTLDASTVATRLLGATVTTRFGGSEVSIRLNEVEAYLGPADPASHAYRSRTKRNEPMFAAGGTLYVYRSYGIHWCLNIVAGVPDAPEGVLLRGGSVVEGLETVIKRRGRSTDLSNGPGKLGQALAVTGADSGSRIASYAEDGRVAITDLPSRVPDYVATPRVGISVAKDSLLRFVVES